MNDPIIINGVSVPRPDRLPLVVGDRVRLRDGYTTKIHGHDGSSTPWIVELRYGERYWKNESGISHNSATDIMEILTPKPDYPMPTAKPDIDLRTCHPDDVLVLSDGKTETRVRFGDGSVGKGEWSSDEPEPRDWLWRAGAIRPLDGDWNYHANGTAYNTQWRVLRIEKAQTTPQPGEVWTMEVKIIHVANNLPTQDPKNVRVEYGDGQRDWIDPKLLKSCVCAAAPKVEVRPGMLVRGVAGGIGTITEVSSTGATVISRDLPPVHGHLLDGAEVRWPWEPESAWRRVSP